jgi:pyruvate/2-oxoglutarate dehydrogenase complex dihydrolipoamide dehydrogenase (E3) component
MTDQYDVIVAGSGPDGGTLTYARAGAGGSAAAVST